MYYVSMLITRRSCGSNPISATIFIPMEFVFHGSFIFSGFEKLPQFYPLWKSVMNGMRTKSWTDQNFVRKIACRKVDANGVEYCFLRIIPLYRLKK